MKITDIKGKPYIEVSERIKFFRANHGGQIITSIVSIDAGVCIFRAEVIVDGKIVATGHAYEKEGSSFINKTSYIENCETSAVGRALGIFGIGIDTSIASAEEVGNAIAQQAETPAQKLNALMGGKDLTDNEKIQLTTYYCNGAGIPVTSMTGLSTEAVFDFTSKFEVVFQSFLDSIGG